MKKTVRAVVDRKEDTLLVLVPDEGEEVYHVSKDAYDLSVNDVCDLTVEDGKVLSVTILKDETERRKSASKSRLSALFAKGKKPSR